MLGGMSALSDEDPMMLETRTRVVEHVSPNTRKYCRGKGLKKRQILKESFVSIPTINEAKKASLTCGRSSLLILHVGNLINHKLFYDGWEKDK
jgi:hypothetical protein